MEEGDPQVNTQVIGGLKTKIVINTVALTGYSIMREENTSLTSIYFMARALTKFFKHSFGQLH